MPSAAHCYLLSIISYFFANYNIFLSNTPAFIAVGTRKQQKSPSEKVRTGIMSYLSCFLLITANAATPPRTRIPSCFAIHGTRFPHEYDAFDVSTAKLKSQHTFLSASSNLPLRSRSSVKLFQLAVIIVRNSLTPLGAAVLPRYLQRKM